MIDTKDSILATAIRLFNERGYSAVSMRDIADELGRSVGNITYHYAKKDQLIADIVARIFEDLGELRIGPVSDVREFDSCVRRMVSFQEMYAFYFAALFEIGRANPRVASYQEKAFVVLATGMDSAMGGLVDHGVLRDDLPQDVRKNIAVSLILVLMSWAQRSGAVKKTEDLHRMIWSVLFASLTDRGRRDYAALSAGAFTKCRSPEPDPGNPPAL